MMTTSKMKSTLKMKTISKMMTTSKMIRPQYEDDFYLYPVYPMRPFFNKFLWPGSMQVYKNVLVCMYVCNILSMQELSMHVYNSETFCWVLRPKKNWKKNLHVAGLSKNFYDFFMVV